MSAIKIAVALALLLPLMPSSAHAVEPPREAPPAQEVKAPATGDAMARVNGTVITRADLERAVKVLVAKTSRAATVEGLALKQAQEVALEQLVDAELLYQEASRKPIPDLEREVERKLSEKRKEFATEEAYQQALKELNLTQAGLRDLMRKDMVIRNFIEERFVKSVTVTEAHMRAFYQENLERYFTSQEMVRASHILVGVEKTATAQERAKAKEKAEAILKKVREGGDFAALAQSDSTCPSAANGGDLGYFPKGKMVPPFESAAFSLHKGQVSAVVETEFGYHIIKVTDRQEKGVRSFEEAKGAIAEFLKQDIPQKALAAFVEELRKKAKVEKS